MPRITDVDTLSVLSSEPKSRSGGCDRDGDSVVPGPGHDEFRSDFSDRDRDPADRQPGHRRLGLGSQRGQVGRQRHDGSPDRPGPDAWRHVPGTPTCSHVGLVRELVSGRSGPANSGSEHRQSDDQPRPLSSRSNSLDDGAVSSWVGTTSCVRLRRGCPHQRDHFGTAEP